MTYNTHKKPILADRALLAMQPKALFSSEQVYAIEQAWFDAGYDSFALMQQAAWQMAQYVIAHAKQRLISDGSSIASVLSAVVWTGAGNNGGDGWLIAHYLHRAGWQVTVVDVGPGDAEAQSDAARAKCMATQPSVQSNGATNTGAVNTKTDNISDASIVGAQDTLELIDFCTDKIKLDTLRADYHIDALFGIGLDRAPSGAYAEAIERFNAIVHRDKATGVAVDIPSGVVATTGQVFSKTAIKADITLCLVAPKLGLYIKDGIDYSGQIIDIPLIPYLDAPQPKAWRLASPLALPQRQQNSHKGSYGHVMIIGGNQSKGSQGMGGAAVMASASALVSGAGKVTAACHSTFHGALLSAQPNAMVVDLQDIESVDGLIAGADIVAIGMGLGRDDNALSLFKHYLHTAISKHKPLVIDADGLYHLATLAQASDPLIKQLKAHTESYQVCLTPHSGEAARLLDTDSESIESDRPAAIYKCAKRFGGDWLLKGAGSLVLVKDTCYVCAAGNPGMATAGMGDVLSGLIAGLMAQPDLSETQRSLYQAVMIHALAGDSKAGLLNTINQSAIITERPLAKCLSDYPLPTVGTRGLQAPDMVAAIAAVMAALIQ